MFDEYQVEKECGECPERAIYCFPNMLRDDMDDFVSAATGERVTVNDVEYKSKMAALYECMKEERPISAYLLKDAFGLLGIETGESLPEVTVRRFSVQNICVERRQIAQFYRACGLEESREAGKGSHTKWTDPRGEIGGSVTLSGSRAIWFRSVVNQVINMGLSTGRVECACRDLSLQFKYLG
jgi:hypothetical protein